MNPEHFTFLLQANLASLGMDDVHLIALTIKDRGL